MKSPVDWKIEKPAGYDWELAFRSADDGELIHANMFGVMSARLVVEQAHRHLALPETDYDIVEIRRLDPQKSGREV